MLDTLEAILSSTIDFAPAMVLAALGGVLSERSGVANIALEGIMRFGAFFAAAGALWFGSPWLGLALGMVAGLAASWVHAYLSIRWRSDQVISGVAVNLIALGSVSFLVEALFGRPDTEATARIPSFTLPWLSGIPVLRALCGHSVLAYLALLLPFLVHFFLYGTVPGLRLRAVGEKPQAAATLGISVARIRYGCVLASGVLAGLGGASLSVSTLDHFNHHMPAGQGFMAVAAVVFGRWQPLGAFFAALFFAGANAAQISLSSSFPWLAGAVPKGFFIAFPYALTLLLLAGLVGKSRPPAALGLSYDPESR